MMFRFLSEIVKGIFSASPYIGQCLHGIDVEGRRPTLSLIEKKANIAKLISKTLITCRV